MLAANSAMPMLAPTEKLAVVRDHQGLERCRRRSTAPSRSSCSTPSSRAFILVWNSRQRTPSPRSHRLAEAFFATGCERRLTSASSSTPAGRSHGVVLAVETELLQLAVVDAVEGAVADGLASSGGTGDALGGEPAGEPGRADLVEQLERAHLPGEAGAHRLVDGGDLVGDRGQPPEGVDERLRQHPPGESAALVGVLEQRSRAALLRRFEARELSPCAAAGSRPWRGRSPASSFRPPSPRGGRSRPCPCGPCSRPRSSSGSAARHGERRGRGRRRGARRASRRRRAARGRCRPGP
jgi:hypothetical protein